MSVERCSCDRRVDTDYDVTGQYIYGCYYCSNCAERAIAEVIDELTIDQCHAITGYRPSLCHSIGDSDRDKLELQLQQARAHVRNKLTTGDIDETDVILAINGL